MIGRYTDDHAELVDLLRTAARGALGGPDKLRLREMLSVDGDGFRSAFIVMDTLLAGLRAAFGDYGRLPRSIDEALNSGDGSYKP